MSRDPIVKGAEWMLSAESGEGSTGAIYRAHCLPCGQDCWWDGDSRPVEAWAIEHTRLEPAHRRFKLVTERFCRVDPVDRADRVGPVGEVEPAGHFVAGPGPVRGRAAGQPPACPGDDRDGQARTHAGIRLGAAARPAVGWLAVTGARRAMACAGRFAGPVLVVTVSLACGFVIGLTLGTE